MSDDTRRGSDEARSEALAAVEAARVEHKRAAARLKVAQNVLAERIRAAKGLKATGDEIASAAGMSRQHVYERYLRGD